MMSFREWCDTLDTHPSKFSWLVLGKGPSFSKLDQYDLSYYRLLSLNHTVRELPVDIAHAIDLDVITDCPQAFDENAKYVLLPFVPHVNNKPGKYTLAQLRNEIPILEKLERESRLLCYNLSTEAIHKYGGTPTVNARYFSSEAAIRLLAAEGISVIRTLGVDGGTTYSSQFSDLTAKTLLANRRSSFNSQFRELAKIILDTGIDLAPLDLESPIRVYVATTEEQMLSTKVLEYSIKKHASMSVKVFPLHKSRLNIPTPKDFANQPRTPFSFQRFLIPALTGYKGKAIYLDSDMQLFADIKQLWNSLPVEASINTVVAEQEDGRIPQFSVLVLDCEALQWDINEIVSSLDRGEISYEDLMDRMIIAENIFRTIGSEWNSMENFKEAKTALLHYTDMPTQPWVCSSNPLGYLWVSDLIEAINNNFISYEFVEDQVIRGYVRPSLLYQIEHGIIDGLLLPKSAKQLDFNFKPPYCKSKNLTRNRLKKISLLSNAIFRDIYRRTGFRTAWTRFRNRRK